MLNQVILMGRLTADLELKSTQNGTSIALFSLAVQRAHSKEKETDFIRVVAWRNTAEFISKYFGKGDMIAIVGSLHSRQYTDRDGRKITTYEVVAEQASFCGNKAEKQNSLDVSLDEFEELTDDPFPFQS